MTETNGDIVERIRKVLALTTSPNPHEAARAAEKVQEMLLAHNLELADVKMREEGEDGGTLDMTEEWLQYAKSRFSPLKDWKERLGNVVARNNDVKVILIHARTHMAFIGYEVNVKAVMRLYEWLVAQLEVAAVPAWSEYTARTKETGEYRDDPLVFRNNFFGAAVNEISDRLREIRRRAQEEHAETMTALVRMHSEGVKAYLSIHYPTLASSGSRRGSDFNSFAHGKGREAGRRADIGQSKMTSGAHQLPSARR